MNCSRSFVTIRSTLQQDSPLASFVLLTFAAGQLLFGQATGSISGTITDTTGSAVPGAKVTVTAPATGLTRSTTTNEAGEYIVPLLGVATYNVKVEQQGFQNATAHDIRLQVDEHRELDFKLSPATVQTSVEVSATPVAVQTSDATLGQVITTQQVTDLPLNGRDFVQLATLTPGTAQETNPNSFFNGGPSSEASARGSYSLSVGGSRANSTDWLLDGNDNNELTAGRHLDSVFDRFDPGVQGPHLQLLGGMGNARRPDGFGHHEIGNRPVPRKPVRVPPQHRSGRPQLLRRIHRKIQSQPVWRLAGRPHQERQSLFLCRLRGEISASWDSVHRRDAHRQPCEMAISATIRSGNRTPSSLTNPNATAGAPFTCSRRQARARSPDGSQTGGTPCNIIPQSLINPIGQELINLYPLPNANNPALGYNYVSQPVRKLDEGKFDIRVDENLSSKDTMFARFSYDQAQSYVPGGAPGLPSRAPFASNQSIANHARNAAISETHIFSPTTVNQLSAGFNRIFDYITSQGQGSFLGAALGIPDADLGGDSARGLTSVELPSPVLVAGRSRLYAVRGRHQCLDALRFASTWCAANTTSESAA